MVRVFGSVHYPGRERPSNGSEREEREERLVFAGAVASVERAVEADRGCTGTSASPTCARTDSVA